MRAASDCTPFFYDVVSKDVYSPGDTLVVSWSPAINEAARLVLINHDTGSNRTYSLDAAAMSTGSANLGTLTDAGGDYEVKLFLNACTYEAGTDSGSAGFRVRGVETVIYPSASVPVGSYVIDEAQVIGGDLFPTGTVDFHFFLTGDCSGTSQDETGVSLPLTYTPFTYANSSRRGPLAAGSYSFKVHYSGDANNAAADSACEVLTVGQTPTTTTTSSTTTTASSLLMGGSVFSTVGSVKLLRSSGEETAAPGSRIEPGTQVETGTNAAVGIKFEEPSVYEGWEELGASTIEAHLEVQSNSEGTKVLTPYTCSPTYCAWQEGVIAEDLGPIGWVLSAYEGPAAFAMETVPHLVAFLFDHAIHYVDKALDYYDRKTGPPYLVATPHAVVAGNGTEFAVSVNSTGTDVMVLSGSAIVYGMANKQIATLSQNQRIFLSNVGTQSLEAGITAFDPSTINRWWSVLSAVAPSLLSPADTYQPAINPASVNFTWSNNGGSGLVFAVYVDRWDYASNSWVSYYVPSTCVQATSLTLTNLPSGSYYAWIVVAVDPTQQSNPWYAWSNWYVFSTT
jgi:hypothetical protein